MHFANRMDICLLCFSIQSVLCSVFNSISGRKKNVKVLDCSIVKLRCCLCPCVARTNRQPLECHLDLLAYNGRKVHYFEYNRRNRRFSDRLLFLPIWGTFFCCGQHCGQKMSAKTHMSGPKSGKNTGFSPFSAKTGTNRYCFRSAPNMRT